MNLWLPEELATAPQPVDDSLRRPLRAVPLPGQQLWRCRSHQPGAIRWRFLGLGRHGSLRGDGVFAALGKNPFDLGVGAGNDV